LSGFVIDASVLIKTVVEENGSEQALALLESGAAVAPDLIMSECANILWKKFRRGEYTIEEAKLAAQLLQRADFEIAPSRMLTEQAVGYSALLDHAAYDCVYLALAHSRELRFVTADMRLVRKLSSAGSGLDNLAVPLGDAPSVLK
jgi:predicted nucleic acid-binding protein